MDDEPHDANDVVTFGPAKERCRLPRPAGTPAAGTRRPDASRMTPNSLLMVAVAIILALTIIVIAQAVQLSGHPARVRTTTPIHVAVGAFAEFPLQGSRGAILQAQYLRAGHGPGSVWLTLAAAGLPGGYDYTALVGQCVRGRPRTLTGLSEIPDYRTGIWLVSFNLTGTRRTIQWVTVTRAGEARSRGGIRGSFVYRGRLVAIRPGHPACP